MNPCNPRCSASTLNCLKRICFVSFLLVAVHLQAQQSRNLELSRPIRSWEFLPVVGSRAGLFGNEAGRFEAWVYPLKLFRDLHLTFHVGDRALPAESLARTLTVHPESASILYAGDSFRVRETLSVPISEPGAVILLEVETEQPLEIEAAFTDDFQLEWPAALGGTYITWDEKEHAFYFGEEARKFAALIGSPTATDPQVAYQTNYSSTEESSMRLGVTQKGRGTKAIVIAASVAGPEEAIKTYERLLPAYEQSVRASADFYRTYLDKTVSLELPDVALQQAYDWARISTLQGLVNNPYLGTGLVAGYRTSGVGQRPGFAWFFGRDSLWTDLALNAEGDYATARTALDFISKYQRADGKVPHEISQSASLVPWFKDYPYPYASADATPLFIIAMEDYATQSSDVAFARDKWDNLWRAYQFMRSTYDSDGFVQNGGVGHVDALRPALFHFRPSRIARRATSEVRSILGRDVPSGRAIRRVSLTWIFAIHVGTRNGLLARGHRTLCHIRIDSSPKWRRTLARTVGGSVHRIFLLPYSPPHRQFVVRSRISRCMIAKAIEDCRQTGMAKSNTRTRSCPHTSAKTAGCRCLSSDREAPLTFIMPWSTSDSRIRHGCAMLPSANHSPRQCSRI